MNDLYYIKYKSALMLLDTMSMSPATELAHRRFCDFLWANEELPQKNDGFFMSVGRVPVDKIPEVRSGLFMKGWTEHGDFLTHGGALESLNEAKEDYVSRYNQTAKMRQVTTISLVTDPVTGIVTIDYGKDGPPTVTEAVTGEAAKTGTRLKSKQEKQSKSESVPSVDIKSNYSIPPKAQGTKLTFLMLDRIAREIVENRHEWDYDNCKVHASQFPPASIVAKLKQFVGVVDAAVIHPAWQEAVTRTHQAAVDGLIKTTPPGYCMTIFTEQLNKLRDTTVAE